MCKIKIIESKKVISVLQDLHTSKHIRIPYIISYKSSELNNSSHSDPLKW